MSYDSNNNNRDDNWREHFLGMSSLVADLNQFDFRCKIFILHYR